MVENEVWKKIIESDKNYEVSNLGRVRNGDTKKILIPRPTHQGYGRVHLSVGSTRKDFYIHRLVAEAFCEHPEGCDYVNHIDNDVTNNCATNLEWVTQRKNVLYAMEQDRVPNFPNAKIVIGKRGNEEIRFNSIREAAEYVGIDHKGISNCCNGKQRTSGGYTWYFEEVSV